jgi:hypothetical protein
MRRLLQAKNIMVSSNIREQEFEEVYSNKYFSMLSNYLIFLKTEQIYINPERDSRKCRCIPGTVKAKLLV